MPPDGVPLNSYQIKDHGEKQAHQREMDHNRMPGVHRSQVICPSPSS